MSKFIITLAFLTILINQFLIATSNDPKKESDKVTDIRWDNLNQIYESLFQSNDVIPDSGSREIKNANPLFKFLWDALLASIGVLFASTAINGKDANPITEIFKIITGNGQDLIKKFDYVEIVQMVIQSPIVKPLKPLALCSTFSYIANSLTTEEVFSTMMAKCIPLFAEEGSINGTITSSY